MKRKILVILSLVMLAGEVFAWSQLYCPKGCFQTKGVPSRDGSYLECPKCGHRWK